MILRVAGDESIAGDESPIQDAIKTGAASDAAGVQAALLGEAASRTAAARVGMIDTVPACKYANFDTRIDDITARSLLMPRPSAQAMSRRPLRGCLPARRWIAPPR